VGDHSTGHPAVLTGSSLRRGETRRGSSPWARRGDYGLPGVRHRDL